MPADLERLKQRLANVPRVVKEAIQPTLQKAGNALVADTQKLAPVSQDGAHGNPPGTLRDSITMTPGGERTPAYSQPGAGEVVADNAVKVTVGNERCRYGHFVEYGTRKMAAEPFFWPAYRADKDELKSAIKKALKDGIKEGWIR